MQSERTLKILEEVAAGQRTPADAAQEIERSQTLVDLGFARVDVDRGRRCGFPEVIFGQGKTPRELVAIAKQLRDGPLLVTRVSPEGAAALCDEEPGAEYDERARVVTARLPDPETLVGSVGIIAAGTSDLPVAEEARWTVTAMGGRTEVLYDAGVAGLHRLLAEWPRLQTSRVLIVIAGFEGALPSVVGGLAKCPVIAVPTSVGYGASFGGLAALLAMLNSCAAGVSVVNIDNGFGAGYSAALINRLGEPKEAQENPQ
ncbi:MAG: nickel pincer cofactor biosynthesis protein LarB [Planctomycetota bacterium]